jgi:hypothetical protein
VNKFNPNVVTIIEGIDYTIDGVYENIPVWLLQSNKAFREESILMSNCLGKLENEESVEDLSEFKQGVYFNNYKNGILLVYSFRNPLDGNKPIATIGLKRAQLNASYKLNKIKGPLNNPIDKIYWKACYKFIEDKKLQVRRDGINIGLLDKKYNNK